MYNAYTPYTCTYALYMCTYTYAYIYNAGSQVQPIPLGATFSNAVSKLKAQSSNVSFH